MLKNKVLALFSISIFLLLLIFSPIAFAQDESVTFTTYYPSPYGDYNDLTTNNFTASTNVTLATEPGSKVGIGTATPGVKLEVLGSTGVTAKILNSVSGAGAGLIMGSLGNTQWDIGPGRGVGNPNDFGFHDGTSTRFVLINNGNVGIGTASPGTSKLKIYPLSTNTIGLDIAASVGGSLVDVVKIQDTVHTGSDLLHLVGDSDGDAGGPYHTVFQSNGNVGIGTTAPFRKLHVNSLSDTGIRVTTTDTVNGASRLELGSRSGQNCGDILFDERTHQLYIYSTCNGGGSYSITLQPGTQGGNVTIPTGNVGIGTTSPQTKLDVNGGVRISGTLDIGWERVSAEIRYPTRGAAVTCSGGKIVLGGGCYSEDYSSAAWLGASAPYNNNGWYCLYPAYPSSFTVYAICARVEPH